MAGLLRPQGLPLLTPQLPHASLSPCSCALPFVSGSCFFPFISANGHESDLLLLGTWV